MILVDEIRYVANGPRGNVLWCHMTSDTGEEELHAAAAEIGLLREWFSDHPTHPHYDLTLAKRKAAIRHGAVEVTGRELVRRCWRSMFRKGLGKGPEVSS